MTPTASKAPAPPRVTNLEIFRAFLDTMDPELPAPVSLKITPVAPEFDRDVDRVLMVWLNHPEEVASWEQEMGGSSSQYEGQPGTVSAHTRYRVMVNRQALRVHVVASRDCGPCLTYRDAYGKFSVSAHQSHLAELNKED